VSVLGLGRRHLASVDRVTGHDHSVGEQEHEAELITVADA
jgi:hypothetical protein